MSDLKRSDEVNVAYAIHANHVPIRPLRKLVPEA